jgi:hypothetical protein
VKQSNGSLVWICRHLFIRIVVIGAFVGNSNNSRNKFKYKCFSCQKPL